MAVTQIEMHVNKSDNKFEQGNFKNTKEALLLAWPPGLQKDGNGGNVFPENLKFGSHFWLASCNSFIYKCPPAKMRHWKWRSPAKLV